MYSFNVVLNYKNTVYFVEAPGIPGGPLIVSQVLKHSMTISWQPPHSDGGSPIKSYIIEKREAPSFAGTFKNYKKLGF